MAGEPFGVNENNPDGIYEPGMKTGSMVTAFMNAYYTRANTSIIGVSASKGGSVCKRKRAYSPAPVLALVPRRVGWRQRNSSRRI